MDTKGEFAGKTVLVTGGSRGIGRAIALAFAGEGASVAVVYARNEEAARETVRQIEAKGGTCSAFRCDVRHWTAVENTVGEIRERMGDVDILVNCAGLAKDSLVASMPVEDWRVVIETNLHGPFHFMRAVIPAMVPKRAGRIINISSISGRRGGRGQANYAASKAGLEALTRAAALELAPRGVTVNAVAPGMIVTEMSATVRELAGEKLARAVPMRRLGVPEDITAAVLFLASPGASYLTGQVIDIDGGLGAAVQ